MASVWEYAWQFFPPDYFSPGGARLTQSPTPPPQQPFVDGLVATPPIRQPPTISPAFGRLDSSHLIAYTPGYTTVRPGEDRIIHWRYRYIYHGESGYGTCGGTTRYTYGEAAQSPMVLAVPDIMAAPSGLIEGWRSISLYIGAGYDSNGGTWGDKSASYCDTDDSLRPGAAAMVLERADGTEARDRDGNRVFSEPPGSEFGAQMGVVFPPGSWPKFNVRVTHEVNTIIVEINVVAYVRVASGEPPPDPPPPVNNTPEPGVPGTPTSGTPSTVTAGVGPNAILRPPC